MGITMMITFISWYFTHGTMVVHPLLYQDTLSTRSQVYETMFLKKQLDHFDEYRGRQSPVATMRLLVQSDYSMINGKSKKS